MQFLHELFPSFSIRLSEISSLESDRFCIGLKETIMKFFMKVFSMGLSELSVLEPSIRFHIDPENKYSSSHESVSHGTE